MEIDYELFLLKASEAAKMCINYCRILMNCHKLNSRICSRTDECLIEYLVGWKIIFEKFFALRNNLFCFMKLYRLAHVALQFSGLKFSET